MAAGGGDGTVGAVASALVGSTAALGVLPLGTLDHFAKDLRIPLDLEAAVRTLAAGRVASVDVGEAIRRRPDARPHHAPRLRRQQPLRSDRGLP